MSTAAQSQVRIYSPFFPAPVTEGAFQVIYDQLHTLHELGCALELVTWMEPAGAIRRKLEQPATPAFPESVRITSFHGGRLRSALPAEWRAVADPAPAAAPRESAAQRALRVARSLASPLASPELYHYPPALDLRAALPAADIGIYHYSFAYTWLRGRPAPEARVQVHLHNLESELARVQAEAERGQGRRITPLVHRLNERKLRRHEQRLPGMAEELWFVSQRDLASLAEGARSHTLRLVPPTFHPELGRRRRQALSERALTAAPAPMVLGFVGACDFEPNRASLAWTVRELAPRLQQRGFTGRIAVAGRGVPEELRQEAERFGFFEWLGFVPDLESFWSGISLLLAPDVAGSGVRIKVLEALASGVPVLTHPRAVQPLAPGLERHPLLRALQDADSWAERILCEQPYQSRCQLCAEPAADAPLDGRAVYEFFAGWLST